MPAVKKRIHSQVLVGIDKDHADHRGKAPMHSTGDLVWFFDDETDARNWFLEYECEVCNEIIQLYAPDTLDLARRALKEANIIKDAGTVE